MSLPSESELLLELSLELSLSSSSLVKVPFFNLGADG
jgi:hypothetical protein